MLTAEQIMTTDVRSVTRDTSLEDLAKVFEQTRFDSLPVIDDEGKLEGVVSQNDLIERDKPLHIPTVISIFDWVLYLASEKSFEKDVKRMAAMTVGEIMKEPRATCGPQTPVGDIAALMSDKQAHLVPVTDEDSKVLGVVARLDMIRAMEK
ncbi:MAG: hypothetical protein C0615_09150 [Desulfuromonas sp.]|nr:MAG: hypothetical protein C0615_09150 [Desulfuromonas sp.]